MKLGKYSFLRYLFVIFITLQIYVNAFNHYFKARSPDLVNYGMRRLKLPLKVSFEECIAFCWMECRGFAYSVGGYCQFIQQNVLPGNDQLDFDDTHELYIADLNGMGDTCREEIILLSELRTRISDLCKYYCRDCQTAQ